jgi:hypothetical protein
METDITFPVVQKDWKPIRAFSHAEHFLPPYLKAYNYPYVLPHGRRCGMARAYDFCSNFNKSSPFAKEGRSSFARPQANLKKGGCVGMCGYLSALKDRSMP